MSEVPDSLPVTEETRERLREQANQLPAPTVIRLIDLLRVAVDDMRQGGDPRLPLELALVKVTRPAADLSREALSLPARTARRHGAPRSHAPARAGWFAERAGFGHRAADSRSEPVAQSPPRRPVELEQLQEAWRRTILPAVEQRSIPIGKTLAEAHPGGARRRHADARVPASGRLPPAAGGGSEERRAAARRALRGDGPQARGRVRARRRATGARRADEGPASEEDVLELMKSTFDATGAGE